MAMTTLDGAVRRKADSGGLCRMRLSVVPSTYAQRHSIHSTTNLVSLVLIRNLACGEFKGFQIPGETSTIRDESTFAALDAEDDFRPHVPLQTAFSRFTTIFASMAPFDSTMPTDFSSL